MEEEQEASTSSRKRTLEPSLDNDSSESVAKKKASTSVPNSKRSAVMNNELILAKIASNMPPRDLCDLRNSCQAWNSNFIPQLKDRQPQIKVTGKSGSLVNLFQVIQASSNNPFTNYLVDLNGEGDDDYGDGDGISAPDRDCFMHFASTFGNTITKLQLIWKRATDLHVSDLRKLIFELTPQLTTLILISSDNADERGQNQAQGQQQQLQRLAVIPNLKQIQVELVLEGEDPENLRWLNSAFTRLMADVIRSAEGLEALRLYDGTESYDFMEPMITELRNASTQSHIHKLKELWLDSETSHLSNANAQDLIDLAAGQDGNANTIAFAPMQLEYFCTSVYCRGLAPDEQEEVTENFRLLHDFLARQSPKLKILSLDFGTSLDSDSPVPGLSVLASCRIPPLEHLKQLELKRCGLGPDEIQFGDGGSDGDFFINLPQLTHFSCECEPRPRQQRRSLAEVAHRFIHPGVTYFHLCTEAAAFMDFYRFRRAFSSLTRLVLTMTSELEQNRSQNRNEGDKSVFIGVKQFSKVWTAWPALTALHLGWNVGDLDLDLDAFVSGIPRKGLESLKHEHKALFPGPKDTDDEDDEGDNTILDSGSLCLREMLIKSRKIRPGISDLKQLKEFVVTFDGKGKNEDNPSLTDIGAYCGIGMASSTLLRVVIQGAGKNLVSKQCATYLRNKFGLLAEISL